jgi:acetaldehyde dehydrogenase (acetylating)
MPDRRIRVAVLGSGNIGIDLCERLLRDPRFEVMALVGRRSGSPGLARFEGRIPHILAGGIESFLPLADSVDGVFDATSAFDHAGHWQALAARGVWMIDLTPSRIGKPMVPVLIGKCPAMEILPAGEPANYSMVTCGGQSSAPLLHSIAVNARGINEVEVSSSIAALSAGPATRLNVDQYIESTEDLARIITGCAAVKAILVLNPSTPPVMMRTTVTVRADDIDITGVRADCDAIVSDIQVAVPGYGVVVAPHSTERDKIVVTARVTGAGYFLPDYAGNLDIINAAAVETARRHGVSAIEVGEVSMA